MANSLSGVFNAVVGPAALAAFKKSLAPLSAFSLDLSATPMSKGGTAVDVPLFTAMTADTDQNDYEDDTGATTSEITVTLNKYAKRTINLSDKEAGQNQIDLWTGMAVEAANAVAKYMIDDVLSVVTNANYGAAGFTGAASGFDADDVATLRTLMNTDGAPKDNRSLVLLSTYTESLITDTALRDASQSNSTDALRNAAVGQIAGMPVIESDIIPGNSENLVGFAAHRSGIGIAMRPFMPQSLASSAGQFFSLVTDPETGLSMGMRSHYSPALGKQFMTFDTWYGYSVAQATGIQRIVSA